MSIWLCLLLEEKNQWVLSWFYKLSSFLDLWFYNVEQNTGRKKNIHLGLQVIFLPWLIGISAGDINVTGSLGCLQNICQDWQQSFNAFPVLFFFFQHVAQTVSDEETDQNWPHLVSPLQTWDMLFISSIFNESPPWEADGALAIINQSWLQWFCEETRNWNGKASLFHAPHCWEGSKVTNVHRQCVRSPNSGQAPIGPSEASHIDVERTKTAVSSDLLVRKLLSEGFSLS